MTYMMSMGTTISVSDEVRKELLKLAAKLQAKIGVKVDYNQVIQYLISKTDKNEQLLKDACTPSPVDISQLREELRTKRDDYQRREKILETKYA